MTVIDMVLIAIVMSGGVRGLMQGAVKTALSLVAWFLALALASRFAQELSILFTDITHNEVMQIALAFAFVVFGVFVVLRLVAWLLLKTLKGLRLGLIDRLLGVALGLAVGILKVLIVLSVVSPLLIKLPSWQTSIFAQALMPFAPVAKLLIVETIGESWQQIQELDLP